MSEELGTETRETLHKIAVHNFSEELGRHDAGQALYPPSRQTEFIRFHDIVTKQRRDAGGVWHLAVYDPDEKYRYRLRREWSPDYDEIAFIGLNPSTATEEVDDPTVCRLVKRAKALGFGAVSVYNLFAFRATDPRVMKKAADPVGRLNDRFLRRDCGMTPNHRREGDVEFTSRKPAVVVCAWGNDGAHMTRSRAVLDLLQPRPLRVLRVNAKTNQPTHPLYLPYDLQPTAWAYDGSSGDAETPPPIVKPGGFR